MISKNLVDSQANDPGLWFEAIYASESYLQQALRKLHEAVEKDHVLFSAMWNALTRLERTASHRARFREHGPVADALKDAREILGRLENKKPKP